jgi:hypothetical protein
LARGEQAIGNHVAKAPSSTHFDSFDGFFAGFNTYVDASISAMVQSKDKNKTTVIRFSR